MGKIGNPFAEGKRRRKRVVIPPPVELPSGPDELSDAEQAFIAERRAFHLTYLDDNRAYDAEQLAHMELMLDAAYDTAARDPDVDHARFLCVLSKMYRQAISRLGLLPDAPKMAKDPPLSDLWVLHSSEISERKQP
jgi:hypothetical protein